MPQLDRPDVSEPFERAGAADGLGPVPPDNRPGAHPGEATDRPDPEDFRQRFGGGEDTEAAAGEQAEDGSNDTDGPGAAAPIMASTTTSKGTLLTLPLRTAAGALRLTADLVSGLARRIDDRRRRPHPRTRTRSEVERP